MKKETLSIIKSSFSFLFEMLSGFPWWIKFSIYLILIEIIIFFVSGGQGGNNHMIISYVLGAVSAF